MLAPSCLTSLDRRKTNTKHTVESRRNLKTSFALYCTVAGLWYSALLKSATPVVPLHHFSRNARKLEWVTGISLAYLSFPLHHLQSQWWFGILFITPHIPGDTQYFKQYINFILHTHIYITYYILNYALLHYLVTLLYY